MTDRHLCCDRRSLMTASRSSSIPLLYFFVVLGYRFPSVQPFHLIRRLSSQSQSHHITDPTMLVVGHMVIERESEGLPTCAPRVSQITHDAMRV